MALIRDLFEASRQLDRRIEKVITFEADQADQLKREITEYVVTENIERSFERLLDQIEGGMGGGGGEIGVWVSGFYGSGKSSLTKYLGFALDPERKVDGKPFLEWLQTQIAAVGVRQRLSTVAKRYPSTVIMIDLASAQIAGATMAEISTVLYWTVLQWAGYPRDKKLAHLQLMLERDEKFEGFERRLGEITNGKRWRDIQNQTLVAVQLSSRLACEIYPELYPDDAAFQRQRIDEVIMEDQRVKEMIDVVRRRSGKPNIIFLLDEVGQYIASRNDLILNLDGLAKNVKNLGGGKVWLIATAQQRLTEDDPSAQHNAVSLFKLKDRFPIDVELEAGDIREICYRRLLTKSGQGRSALEALFDKHGPSLTHYTQIANTRYYKSDLDKKAFADLYPFLPQHFDILLEMLGRLAKTSGGVGLRSAIKVIQDVLVDKSGYRSGSTLLADDKVGRLATTVVFYDTLRHDIQRSFAHLVTGVDKAAKAFGDSSAEVRVAKTIAVLQVLNDFPSSRENIAALLHDSVDGGSGLETVRRAVDAMFGEKAVPLSEIDGKLRFMSEAVAEIEAERGRINVATMDIKRELNAKLTAIFTPLPSVRLAGTRTVTAGIKSAYRGLPVTLAGEREPVQMIIDLVTPGDYDRKRDERLVDSGQPGNQNIIYLHAREPSNLENLLEEIVLCSKLYQENRNKPAEKEVVDYLRSQNDRAENLRIALENNLRQSLIGGSFIFRSVPTAAAVLDAEIVKASARQLDDAAGKVFLKYQLAPIQADGSLAEKFLRTPNLAGVSSQVDPLTLVVTQNGQKKINVDHAALVAIRDYLDKKGQVEGGALQDDFFAPEFGWSKDTTRYLLAALFSAGLLKLRIAGADVLVKGDTAVDALKNNNNFKRIGVALRNTPISLETKDRAATRVLDITGEAVMPLEQDISQAVMRYFPAFRTEYAPLDTRLAALELPGTDRAAALQEDLREILLADASDATPILGAEKCELHENLIWARKVMAAFVNGIDGIIRELRSHIQEIQVLPEDGCAGDLRTATDTVRAEAGDILFRDDFYDRHTDLKNLLNGLQSAVKGTCSALATELNYRLASEMASIQAMPEWLRIGAEMQVEIVNRLEALRISAGTELAALKMLLGHSYKLSVGIDRIRAELKKLGTPAPEPEPTQRIGEDTSEEPVEVNISVPATITLVAQIDQMVDQLQEIKKKVAAGVPVRITWLT